MWISLSEFISEFIMGRSTEVRSLRKRVWLAIAAWLLVLAAAALPKAGELIYGWLSERCRAGEAGVSRFVWTAVDLVFPFLFCWRQLLSLMLLVATVATWAIVSTPTESLSSRAASHFVKGLAWVSSVAVLIAAFTTVIGPVFVLVTRPLICRTDVYDEAISPNGLYKASVVQLDCGAMSSFNRQVVLAPRFFPFQKTSMLYLRDHPKLHLRWSGRTLTIEGDRSLESIDHTPSGPVLWGGVLIRYSGPGEKQTDIDDDQ